VKVFFLCSDQVKFSLDKYVALQVRCYGYVREVLKSEEVRFRTVAKMMILYCRSFRVQPPAGSLFETSLRRRSQRSILWRTIIK